METELKNPLRDLAIEIAAALSRIDNTNWTIGYMQADHQQDLKCTSHPGMGLYLEYQSYKKDKIEIHATFSLKERGSRGYRPKRGVTIARGIPAIAAEIKKHIIPDALKTYAKLVEENQRFEQAEQVRKQTFERLTKLTGINNDRIEHRDSYSKAWVYKDMNKPSDQQHLEMEMYSDNSINLKIDRLSPQQTAFILQFLYQ